MGHSSVHVEQRAGVTPGNGREAVPGVDLGRGAAHHPDAVGFRVEADHSPC